MTVFPTVVRGPFAEVTSLMNTVCIAAMSILTFVVIYIAVAYINEWRSLPRDATIGENRAARKRWRS